MERTIKIDGKDVKFKATASTIRRYRAMYGRDLLVDFQKLWNEAVQAADPKTERDLSTEALTIFENMAYTMAKQADPTIPDNADDWLDGFDMFSIYMILPELVELWQLSEMPTAVSKKKV